MDKSVAPYQALARRYRPQQLSDVVGQEPIVNALKNALQQNKLHHAYLFTGNSGTGKTTLARIFATSLNCEVGVTAFPCLRCQHCQQTIAGNMPDLLEIDAASRTKVEDTRALLEGVAYAPMSGRYKVYLIDEVHMLSNHSFNALLKTLEEPPEHVKFFLATTDPHKIPATILSRCIQFQLRTLPEELIVKRMQHILQIEQVDTELEALQLIAKAAAGSMRDSLSLLDQAIHLSAGTTMQSKIVKQMLGLQSVRDLSAILSALQQRSAEQLQNATQKLVELGADPDQVLAQLAEIIYRIAELQLFPNLSTTLPVEQQYLRDFTKQFDAADLQLYYDILIKARVDLPYAPSATIGLQMALIRLLAFLPAEQPAAKLSNEPIFKTEKTTEKLTTTNQLQSQTPAITSSDPWSSLLSQLSLKGLTATLAQHCSATELTASSVILYVEPQHAALVNERQKQLLTQALAQHFNNPALRLEIHTTAQAANNQSPSAQRKSAQQQQLKQAEKELQADPGLQNLLNAFSTTLQADNIEVDPI